MTEKTEDQIAREKAAVEAMKNAKASMSGALERIATLEQALRNAQSSITRFKRYVAPEAYGYRGEKPLRHEMDETIGSIAKVLS